MKLNPNIPPPNGFVFTEADGTVFRGTTLVVLARKVLVYRNQTGGNTSDVLGEVQEQICKTIPDHCHGDGSPRAALKGAKTRNQTLKTRVLGYLGTMARVNKPAKVDSATTAERVRVCQKCPKRHSIQESCGGCKKSTELLRSKCLGGSAPIAPNLGACDALGVDLAVAVHLRETPINNPELPPHCWRKA